MAHVSKFKYDIFISYAHDDNAHAPDRKGWVDQFHEELNAALVRRFGRNEIKIWRDIELDENTIFNDEIKAAVENSALFLGLNSPRYLDSDYCRDEYTTFYNHAQKNIGLVLQNKSRLFNVLLRNINFNNWPDEFKDRAGFVMHDATPNSDEAGEPILIEDKNFAKQLRRIVDAIEETLTVFHQTPAVSKTDSKKSIFVYVADVVDSLFSEKNHLIQELQSETIKVVGNIPPPYDRENHATAVRAAMTDSRLSIHMFDQWPGRPVEGQHDITYPVSQFNIGLGETLSQLIWIPEKANIKNIEDPGYAEFLRSLESDERRGEKFELIRKGKTEFLQIIAEKIQQLTVSTNEQDEKLPILVDTHQKDQNYAFKLCDILTNEGLDVEITKESRDPLQTLKIFEDYLKYVKNLIIMFGDVTPSWVLGRLKKTVEEITKQALSHNHSNFECCYVYMLPHSDKTKDFNDLPGFFKIEYLDNRHSPTIDQNVIRPILQKTDEGNA